MTRTSDGRAVQWQALLVALFALVVVASACGDNGADNATRTGESAPASGTDTTSSPGETASDAIDAAEPDAAREPAPPDDGPDSSEGGEQGEDQAGGTESRAESAVEDEPEAAGGASETTPAAEVGPEVEAGDDAVERIVSISPTGTEMLFAIGAGDRVVAVDQFSYFPEEAPVTDLDGWSPNIEAIAAYEPDLVVLQAGGDVIASLEALGIMVFAHAGPLGFNDVYAQIEELGAMTGQTDEAAALVADMRAQIAELIAAAPDAAGLTYYHELDNTLYSVTSNTLIGQVYGLFGLVNVADPADSDGSAFGYPQLSDEYLVDADPDVVFLADTLCCGQSAQTVSERPGWDELTAVQAGRIFELNDDVASRWGPRLVDFIAAISDALTSMDAAS